MQPKNFKDHMRADRGADASLRTARRLPGASETLSGRSNLIEFRPRVDSSGPQDPEPTSNSGPSVRPCQFILDDYRDNVLMAIRQGRDYRNIARQYGVSALEIWRIASNALQQQTRRAA